MHQYQGNMLLPVITHSPYEMYVAYLMYIYTLQIKKSLV